MKELEKKIMDEVLHVVHSPEHSLSKLREIVKECLEQSFNNGYNKAERERAIDEAGADY